MFLPSCLSHFFLLVRFTYLFIYRHLNYLSCVVTSLYRLEPGDSFGRALLYGYELLPSFPPHTLSIVLLEIMLRNSCGGKLFILHWWDNDALLVLYIGRKGFCPTLVGEVSFVWFISVCLYFDV